MKKGIAKFLHKSVKLCEIDRRVNKVLEQNQSKLNLSKKQQEHWHKKYMCLVEFQNAKEIEPLDFDHQSNMDDWLIIERIQDVVMGTSIPYNYEKSKF